MLRSASVPVLSQDSTTGGGDVRTGAGLPGFSSAAGRECSPRAGCPRTSRRPMRSGARGPSAARERQARRCGQVGVNRPRPPHSAYGTPGPPGSDRPMSTPDPTCRTAAKHRNHRDRSQSPMATDGRPTSPPDLNAPSATSSGREGPRHPTPPVDYPWTTNRSAAPRKAGTCTNASHACGLRSRGLSPYTVWSGRLSGRWLSPTR
jgi:hypothetical protein